MTAEHQHRTERLGLLLTLAAGVVLSLLICMLTDGTGSHAITSSDTGRSGTEWVENQSCAEMPAMASHGISISSPDYRPTLTNSINTDCIAERIANQDVKRTIRRAEPKEACQERQRKIIFPFQSFL